MDSDSIKKPFKMIEIPLNNFREVAIPYHQNLCANYKEKFSKQKNYNTLKILQANVNRSVAQLKDLQNELDSLRAQVIDSDLNKFDSNSVVLRKLMLKILNDYTDLVKNIEIFKNNSTEECNEEKSHEDVKQEIRQLKLDINIEEVKLQEKESHLREVEEIQNEIEDIHSTYSMLHSMVTEQSESVNIVENNVEVAQENVNAGTRHLVQCTRIRAAILPLAGAAVGGCVIGPLGFIAGLKFGSLAAVSGGILGYAGGTLVKDKVINKNNEMESEIPSNTKTKDD